MKIFNRYSDFVKNIGSGLNESSHYQMINENVDQAKTYMKNRALSIKRERSGGEDPKKIGLTPQEQRMAENDSEFRKVRELCAQDPPLVFTFTKFYFEDLAELDPNLRMEEGADLIAYDKVLNISKHPFSIRFVTVSNKTFSKLIGIFVFDYLSNRFSYEN